LDLLGIAGRNLRPQKILIGISTGSIILITCCSTAFAETYYVDNCLNIGSDSNNGTSESTPWLTIAHVNSRSFNPGDTIEFRSGCTWREELIPPGSGSSGKPITFEAYGTGSPPIVSGADVVKGWSLYSGNIYGYTLPANAGVILEDGSPLTFLPWNANVSTTFSGAAAGSYSVNPNTYTAYIWMSDSSNPSGHTIEVSQRKFGVYGSGRSYITLAGLTIEDASGFGIAGYAMNDWTITSSTIRNVGGIYTSSNVYVGNGIEFDDNSSNDTVSNSSIYNIFESGISPQPSGGGPVSNISITGSTIYDFGEDGVEISSWLGSGSTISNVSVSSNAIYGGGRGWSENRGATGILLKIVSGSSSEIVNTAISENSIYNNLGRGIDMEDHAGNATITQNAIYDNSLQNIYCQDTTNPNKTSVILSHNLVYGAGADGLLWNTNHGVGFTLYNNEFYNNGSDADGTYNVRLEGAASIHVVQNNIFYGVNSYALYDDWGHWAGSEQDYNVYYRASGSLIYWNQASYSTSQFSNYRSGSGGQDSNGMYAHPEFTSTSPANACP
jgi:Right handed beta helix region